MRGQMSAPVDGDHQLLGFTNDQRQRRRHAGSPQGHATSAEVDVWIEAETADALILQTPLPDDALRILAKGEKNRWSDTLNRRHSPCKGIRVSPNTEFDIRQDKLCRERFHSLVVMLFLQKSNYHVVSRSGVAYSHSIQAGQHDNWYSKVVQF